jgi:putative ABC transport system substrate-binding protein
MRRRDFITALGGAAAMPLAVRGQDTVPVIGYLGVRSLTDVRANAEGFRRGLAEHGFVEGQNIRIEYRAADGRYDRLPALAAELVNLGVSLFVATGGELVALAAKTASPAIPLVFVVGSDPVKLGLVMSDNRPGGNATGINILTNTVESKRLGLLHELVPHATTVGVLLNPDHPPSVQQLGDLREAARTIGLSVHELRASTDREIEAAFEAVAQRRVRALVVTADPSFNVRHDKLTALAKQYAVPTIYHLREYVLAGGLISYGVDLADAYRQVASYAGRILKGAKPADLPVVQPTKFEFVLNLKTATALGLEISPTLLARADEVIE